MHAFPHIYTVTATGAASGTIPVTATELPTLSCAAPREFDGPGDQWSPESMLCAAVASCFVLTFRAVARASKLEWAQLACTVDGKLERVDNVTRFTRFVTRVTLTVAGGADEEKCRQVLDKAEHGCLVANSLTAERVLEIEIATL